MGFYSTHPVFMLKILYTVLILVVKATIEKKDGKKDFLALFMLKALLPSTIYNNNQSLSAFQYNMGGALATINWLQKVDN